MTYIYMASVQELLSRLRMASAQWLLSRLRLFNSRSTSFHTRHHFTRGTEARVAEMRGMPEQDDFADLTLVVLRAQPMIPRLSVGAKELKE